MINVLINRDGLEAEGHAGYAPYGQDIVCAGITSLFNAFIISARQDIEALEVPGLTRIKINNPTTATMAKYEMLVHGIQDFAEEYPEYVHIHANAFMALKETIQSSIETITR